MAIVREILSFRSKLISMNTKMLFIAFLMSGLMFACQETASEEASTEETAATEQVEAAFFGDKFDVFTPVSSTDLASQMVDGSLEEVQVTGEVLAACKNKGCWMTMPIGDGEEMRVTFKDYGFFVPKDCAGQTATIQGRAYYDTTSVEDLRHYAVDGGMTEEEAAEKYTEAEIAISFEATGVQLGE